MLSKSSQPVRPLKGNKMLSTIQQDKQSHTPAKVVRTSAAGPSLSSSSSSSSSAAGRTTCPGPSRARPFPSTLTESTSATTAGRRSATTKVNATRLYGQSQEDDGPLDDYIMDTLEDYEELKDAIAAMREHLVVYRTLAYDGRVYRGQWLPHIMQLNRVLDQLQKTGQCVIAGKVFRP